MGYTSLTFIIFLLITGIIYYLKPFKTHQWAVLLVSSFIFYASISFKYIEFIIITIVTTWLGTTRIGDINKTTKRTLHNEGKNWDRTKKTEFKNKNKATKRKILRLYLLVNLGILILLKYSGFIADTINGIFHLFSIPEFLPHWKFFLPLGISFYTFQSIAYVADVYNGEVEPERNVFKLALFLSFFPQIVQGPISFFDQLGKQLFESHPLAYKNVKYGVELMLWGYFKKMVIADRLVMSIDTALNNYCELHGCTILAVLIIYSVQLYADFSGGIDISRGIAQMFGIDMVQNFRQPYFATSINDFWRRWHITLGAFMKKYIFYSVAMSDSLTRIGKAIQNTSFGKTEYGKHVARVFPASIASLVVFLVVGIWHGASWRNVGFGVWNGTIIMCSVLLQPMFQGMTHMLHINTATLPFRCLQIFRTYLIMVLSYVFDIADRLMQSLDMLKKIFCDLHVELVKSEISQFSIISKRDLVIAAAGVFVLFICSLVKERKDISIREQLDKHASALEWVLIVACVIMIISFGVYGPEYNANDFIYMQF